MGAFLARVQWAESTFNKSRARHFWNWYCQQTSLWHPPQRHSRHVQNTRGPWTLENRGGYNKRFPPIISCKSLLSFPQRVSNLVCVVRVWSEKYDFHRVKNPLREPLRVHKVFTARNGKEEERRRGRIGCLLFLTIPLVVYPISNGTRDNNERESLFIARWLRNFKSRTSPERCETGREGGWKIRFSWLIECKLTLDGSLETKVWRMCKNLLFRFLPREGGRI